MSRLILSRVVQDQKNQGAAQSVRREDELPMAMPFWLQIGSPSAWADGLRPSLSARGRLFMSKITFLSCPSVSLRQRGGAEAFLLLTQLWIVGQEIDRLARPLEGFLAVAFGELDFAHGIEIGRLVWVGGDRLGE